MNPEPISAYRMSRKVKTGGSQGMSLFLGVLGLLFLVLFWPLGLLLILLAFFADAKYKQAHYCGSCGNDIASTSRLCPICRAELVSPIVGQQVGNAVKKAVIAFATVILLIIVVVMVVKNYQ